MDLCEQNEVCSMDSTCRFIIDCRHAESLTSQPKDSGRPSTIVGDVIDYPGLSTQDVAIHSPNFLYTRPVQGWESRVNEFIEFLSIPKKEIPGFAKRFIDAIETQETLKWCACTWKIHPDDTEKPFMKQRKVRIDANEWCVLHTKVGLILGFFAFVFGGEDANTPIRVQPDGD